MANKTPFQIITEAVKDLTENGFSPARMAKWVTMLRIATHSFVQTDVFAKILKARFEQATRDKVLQQQHIGVSRFTLDRIKPELRNELQARIVASADLIKLNREAAIQKTIQRFSGWATSVPQGGTEAINKPEVKSHILKPIEQTRYEENRVANDQGHKMVSAINQIIAKQTGAIAAQWFSHWHQAGYDYREDHKERDGSVYAIRGNWAMEKGLMKAGPNGYTDDITKPAEEINCRCRYTYFTSLRDLPDDMLTIKGREALKQYAVS